MPAGLLFWIIMLIWILAGLWSDYTPGQPYPFKRLPGNLMTFVLFLVIGWKVFGPPIQ